MFSSYTLIDDTSLSIKTHLDYAMIDYLDLFSLCVYTSIPAWIVISV